MSKRLWITVRRGILDPKHFVAMGIDIWPYLYIIDHADWETGTMYDWVDKDVAEDLGSKERTVREMRRRLEDKGYIAVRQRRRNLEIAVTNWLSPYDLAAISKGAIEGDIQNDTQNDKGDIQGDIEGGSQNGTLPLDQTSNIKLQVGEMDKEQQNELLAKTYQKTNASTPGIEKYPEEVQEVVSLFCELYHFKAPLKGGKTGSMAFWITGARELIEAAGEFGLDAIREQRKDFEAHMATHGGIAPFTVSSPKSIVNAVRAKAATMREARPSNSGFRFDW